MNGSTAAVLAAQALGVPAVGVEQVAGSVGNHNFRVRFADGTDVILKSAPLSFLAAEAWACRRMRAAGLPAPEVAAHSPEVPFLILRVLPGEPTTSREVWRQTGRAMRVAHRLPLSGYGRLAVDNHGVRGRYDTWQEVLTGILNHVPGLMTAGILTPGLADRAVRVVRSSPVMERRQPGVLLHQDLKPQHVFAVDGRLAGIIDWGDVGVGDPVWDIAGVSRAGQDVLNAFLDGYQRERSASLEEDLRAYRILRDLEALHFEHQLGGDWFDAYRDRIDRDTADRPHQGE